MDYKVKLGATLSFNLGLERDMVEQIESLKAKHKLGEFISNSLRIVFENPELLEKYNLSLEKYGLTDNRKKLNDAINIELGRLGNKIEKTYQMAYEVYSLAKFNKQLNIHDTARNILASQFILNKQIEDLKSLLGVTCIDQPVNLHKVDKSIDDILEYILLCHSDIVDELKSNLTGNSDYIDKLKELSSLADKHISQVNSNDTSEKERIYNEIIKDSLDNEEDEVVDIGINANSSSSSAPKLEKEAVKEPVKSEEEPSGGFEISDDASMDDVADLLGLM
jgi:hypothetical protein